LPPHRGRGHLECRRAGNALAAATPKRAADGRPVSLIALNALQGMERTIGIKCQAGSGAEQSIRQAATSPGRRIGGRENRYPRLYNRPGALILDGVASSMPELITRRYGVYCAGLAELINNISLAIGDFTSLLHEYRQRNGSRR